MHEPILTGFIKGVSAKSLKGYRTLKRLGTAALKYFFQSTEPYNK